MSLRNAPAPNIRLSGPALAVVGLVASVFALAAAPFLMPEGYSWTSNTISESAAQGLPGAWMARLGFVLFGLSVILLAVLCRRHWGPWATGLHATFGALMTATAAFSHRPWITGQVFDRTEDLLHSVTATAMGFAFAFGVVAAALWHNRARGRRRGLDFVAVVASVAIPLAMSVWPDSQGVVQRLMFAVAYTWYGVEAIRNGRTRAAEDLITA